MINPEVLLRPPVKEHPILTDDQVQIFFRKKIQHTVGRVQNPIHLYPFDQRDITPLFRMQGGEEYTLLKTGFGSNTCIHGRVETTRVQELAFEVMKEFGFDPALTDEDKMKTVVDKGVNKRTEIYPSRAIEGLVFERVESAVESERPFRVEWSVRDAVPKFRIGRKNIGT